MEIRQCSLQSIKFGLLGGGETSRLSGSQKPLCQAAFLNLGLGAASDFLGNTAKCTDVLEQLLARTSKLNSIAGAAGRVAVEIRQCSLQSIKFGLLGGGEESRLSGCPKPFCQAAFLNLGL